MTTLERNSLFTSNYIVVVTSLVFFFSKYFMSFEGDWGVETHPLAIWLQKVHILSVPFLLFFVGVVFSNHILKRIVSGYRPSRKSGLFLVGLLILMSLSGYLIQVVDSTSLREWAAYIHIGVSVIWCILFTFHHIVANKKLRI